MLTELSVSTRVYVLVRANLKVSVQCMYASDALYLNNNSRLVFIIIFTFKYATDGNNPSKSIRLVSPYHNPSLNTTGRYMGIEVFI